MTHAQLLHVLRYLSPPAFRPFSIISMSSGGAVDEDDVARAGGRGRGAQAVSTETV